MPPGLTSPFTFEERKWIILKFGELKSATLVRRAFQKQFPKSSPRDVPNRKQFQRVLEQFNGSGDVGEAKPKHNVKDSVPQADTDFFSNIHKIFNSEPIFKIPKPQKTSKAQE